MYESRSQLYELAVYWDWHTVNQSMFYFTSVHIEATLDQKSKDKNKTKTKQKQTNKQKQKDIFLYLLAYPRDYEQSSLTYHMVMVLTKENEKLIHEGEIKSINILFYAFSHRGDVGPPPPPPKRKKKKNKEKKKKKRKYIYTSFLFPSLSVSTFQFSLASIYLSHQPIYLST